MSHSSRESTRAWIRQLGLVVAGVTAFALVLPVGARASGQLVTLVDPSNTHKARVDGTGRLTVVDQPLAATPWSFQTNLTTLFDPPSGVTRLVVGSVTVMNGDNAPALVQLELVKSGSTTDLDRIEVPAQDTVHLVFPQPLVLAPGGSNWIFRFSSTSPHPYVTAVGYYV